MRATGVVLEPRVDLEVGTGAIESDSPGYIRQSSVQPLDWAQEALIGAAKTLLGAAKSLMKV